MKTKIEREIQLEREIEDIIRNPVKNACDSIFEELKEFTEIPDERIINLIGDVAQEFQDLQNSIKALVEEKVEDLKTAIIEGEVWRKIWHSSLAEEVEETLKHF